MHPTAVPLSLLITASATAAPGVPADVLGLLPVWAVLALAGTAALLTPRT